MSTEHVDALLSLLEQLRGASRLGRAKVLAQAVKVLRSMTSAERKAMIVEVASQTAPDLVAGLEATGGQLTPHQLSQFVSMAQRLDNEQIAAIAAAVRNRDFDDPTLRAVAAQAATSTLDALAPPVAGEALQLPPPSVEDAPSPDAPSPDERAPDGPVEVMEREEVDWDAADEGWQEAEEAWLDQDDEPLAEPSPDAANEVLAQAEDELTAEATTRAAQVASTPDGWRRRRMLLDLAAADVIADEEAVALVASLARASDRAWVAGALLDRGLVLVEQVEPLLSERAATRLRNRMAA